MREKGAKSISDKFQGDILIFHDKTWLEDGIFKAILGDKQ